MSETPNHEYNVPAEGDENWHQPLNANFEALEVDIELRDEGGPTEGTNDYDPADGAKYLDTATGLVYLADGSTWNQVFDLSGSGGGGIQGLSGGDGINPDTIGDGDTLTAAWGDATSLDSNGDINDFSGATDLDSAGTVSQLSGSVTGGQTLTSIAGNNLSIDASGQLNASGGSGGIQGLSGGDGINPGSIGDGDTLTVAWGDAASLDSSGTVDAGRYLTTSSGTVDFAGPAEWSNAGQTTTNTVSGTAATVAGGERHEASASWATIGGGDNNLANALEATVAGGFDNSAEAQEAAVGGGEANTASGQNSTVPGGQANTASGAFSFAAGRNATANNDGSFVVGDSTSTEITPSDSDEAVFQMPVNTSATFGFTDNSIFLSAFENDDGNDLFTVSVPGQYFPFDMLRVVENGNVTVAGNLAFSGGLQSDTGTNVVINSDNELAADSSSARHKTDIQPHSTSDGVLDLELRSFQYEETGSEDVGFIAEEVEEHVPEIVTYDDEDRPFGVKYDRVGAHLVPEVRDNRDRLADVESEHDAVDDRVADLKAELDAKDARIDDQQDRIEKLEAENERLTAENDALRERVAAIEDKLGIDADQQAVADD